MIFRSGLFSYMRFLLFLLAFAAVSVAQINIYPNYAKGLEFWTLNGKTADPCVNKEELAPGTGAACKQICTGKQ